MPKVLPATDDAVGTGWKTIRLRLSSGMHRRLEYMARQTANPDGLGVAVHPAQFASELLEVAILEAWEQRGRGGE